MGCYTIICTCLSWKAYVNQLKLTALMYTCHQTAAHGQNTILAQINEAITPQTLGGWIG